MKVIHKISIISVLLIGLSGLFSSQAYAQKGNVLKINIFSPIASTLNLQYERKVSGSSSFQLGFYYSGFSINETKFSGIGITPEYRFYLSETEAPNGFYVAPFIRYQNFTVSNGPNEGTITTTGGGLIIGKQWIFKEKIALDIFLGPKYSSRNVTVTSGTDTFDTGNGLSGFGIRAGVCFGLAF
ncbi:MAG: DUF3575 domain-containing protein [Bacteroidia bacterium]|nr:DUF3575 domain-containing protein [Bacteroidia bacterium]